MIKIATEINLTSPKRASKVVRSQEDRNRELELSPAYINDYVINRSLNRNARRYKSKPMTLSVKENYLYINNLLNFCHNDLLECLDLLIWNLKKTKQLFCCNGEILYRLRRSILENRTSVDYSEEDFNVERYVFTELHKFLKTFKIYRTLTTDVEFINDFGLMQHELLTILLREYQDEVLMNEYYRDLIARYMESVEMDIYDEIGFSDRILNEELE